MAIEFSVKFKMIKLLVIVCAALIFQVSSSKVQPRDLVDEAYKQLDLLKSTVQGEIQVAHGQLDNLATDFVTSANNVVQDGGIEIQEEHGTIIAQINTLKELANGAGKDVSSCTDIREQVLNRLPSRHTEDIRTCVVGLINESTRLLNDASYIIDVNINKVHSLENSIFRCSGSLVCIQPIITEIQLDMIRLPAAVKTEVTAVESQLSTVNIGVSQCSEEQVTKYVSEASSILVDITACINRILDRPWPYFLNFYRQKL